MALLQISEPGQNALPHAKQYTLGIDLGTTNTLVATVRSAQPQILKTEDESLIPSVVTYSTSNPQVVVGTKALGAAVKADSLTIRSVKRFMGRSAAEIKFSHPYPLVDRGDSMPAFNTPIGLKSPVEVSADILTSTMLRAEAADLGDLAGAVVTVPAYFDESQREATRKACELAGIPLLKLLNEPTAAALAYGKSNPELQKDGHVLVFDLGGGTFDVSILKIQDQLYEVLATGGHTSVGGDDADRLIAKWLRDQASTGEIDTQAQHELEAYAREIKQQLSNNAKVEVNFQGFSGVLTQDQLSDMIAPITDLCLKLTERALRDAGLTKDQLGSIILVGGSTRMPAVQQAVQAFFDKEPMSSINPDEVVALGAALHANDLTRESANRSNLIDVTPLSLGLETMGGLVERIISRNTPIPISKKQTFTTYQDGQTGLIVHVVQGEREQVTDCRSLAKFTLSGIPPMKAGVARIEVNFSIDTNGLLQVSATEVNSGVQASINVKPTQGLSEEDQQRLLTEGMQHAEQDKNTRQYLEDRLEAERELEALTPALSEFGHLISDDQAEVIQHAMQVLELAINQTKADDKANQDQLEQIRSAHASLKKLSDPFAAAIMNQAVSSELSGKTPDQI
jgi:molecular chaperone HscA